ncbi:T9SS type A sorting domain-containing protein [Aquimarina sp. ERC-38]|uniref:T9SS type A sorting domain-containing protein n=1 Tax=Aquimarina sp. ERC-38 TaxID=2949996 RepID=UPI0022457369|nr:T9SS type A sorting domain-containing protein [Aquimarina sp. ERC-38]UZO80502.1 T9SS type A sorting domain-containing protein [Aquimarina sp. ERC-38]
MNLNYTSKILGAVFVLLCIFSFQAQTVVNFDAERDSSKPLNTEIQRVIRSNPGAIIEFRSSTYNLENRGLSIPEGVTLRGVTTRSITPNLSGRGADNRNIRTRFINCENVVFRADNIKMQGLEFVKTTGQRFNVFFNLIHPTYTDGDLDTNDEYTGIELDNVKIVGGGYAVAVGNGFGGTFNNVSIVNFNVIGVWFNRTGNVDEHSRVTFTNCTFEPRNEANSAGNAVAPGSKIEFNDRGISIDGGNTSYPIVWDHNGTRIEKCLFIDTGIGASSRGTDVIVNNNEFRDSEGVVEHIRVEEFSSNFKIINNLFNCNNARSKIITFDRELQGVSDIDISGNKVTGLYLYFLSAYAPNNLTIRNNDFTGAREFVNSVGRSVWINLTFYENAGKEPISPRSSDLPGEFVTNGLTVSGNTGLGNKIGSLTVNLPQGNRGFNSDFPANRTIIRNFAPPKPLLRDGIYEIVNKGTTKKMIPNSNNDRLSTTSASNSATRWRVTFIPPFYYTIQNVATNEYLELDIPFTESNIIGNPNNLPNLFPFAKNTFNNFRSSLVNRLPFWSFQKRGNDFVIFPGGNEKQSAIAATPNDVVNLVTARQKAPNSGARIPRELGDDARWSFRSLSDNFLTWNTSAREFTTGQNTNQSISYEVRKANEVLQSVDFGLVIINKNTNAVVRSVSSVTPVNARGSSSNTVRFNYTIPSNAVVSANLPQNQGYAIRSRLVTKVNGRGADIIEEFQVPVAIFGNITASEITWDTNSVTEFSLGATTQQTITHNTLPSETPDFTQFGLFVVSSNNNSVVSAITPQVFPSVARNIKQRDTQTFSFTVPNNIVPSSGLPAGQRYAIRVILGTKDAAGNDKFTSEITPVTISAANTVAWETSSSNLTIGESKRQRISYSFQNSQSLSLLQFGLIVRDANTNTFIREIAPQTNLEVPAGPNSGTQTFNFTTPATPLSSELATGEKYTLRVRLQTTDTAGNVITTLSFTDVSVESSPSSTTNPPRPSGNTFIRWENFTRQQRIGARTTQTISYRVQENQILRSVQFGLIVTTRNNKFVRVASRQVTVGDRTSPKEAENVDFAFTIPTSTEPSRALPNNQKYRMRLLIRFRDSAGKTREFTRYMDVNVVRGQVRSTASLKSAEETTLSVYPNPASDVLFISGQEEIVNANYRIYTISGQLILSTQASDRINVSNLSAGMYFLKTSTGIVKFLKQ